ncbi:MAG: hypothetical protein NTZ20_00740 [Candidatus Levybacteria bacterium]|nr:hypothetical protein [Candidatus Levybacteria bacterium]
MIKHSEHHIGYYISLFLIFIFSTIIMLNFSQNKQIQASIIVLTAFSYVLFGIIHHKVMHDLTSKIVIEYILIGSLGISVVIFFITGGFLS